MWVTVQVSKVEDRKDSVPVLVADLPGTQTSY